MNTQTILENWKAKNPTTQQPTLEKQFEYDPQLADVEVARLHREGGLKRYIIKEQSKLEALKRENVKFEKQIEELKQRSDDAMKLSMEQHERFMDQLEEKDNQIEELNKQIKLLKDGPVDKYAVGDVIRLDDWYGLGVKFLMVKESLKTQYKVVEVVCDKTTVNYPDRQEWEDFWMLPKDRTNWTYEKHKNIGKKKANQQTALEGEKDYTAKDTSGHYVSTHYHYLR
jgi:cell division protein FtsB